MYKFGPADLKMLFWEEVWDQRTSKVEGTTVDFFSLITPTVKTYLLAILRT